MVGRNTLADGSNDFTVVGYPSVKLPAAHQGDFTIVHAIARQESQFDRAAVSHAGARGLMQLMPGTAREVANGLGLDYKQSSMTFATGSNLTLGTRSSQSRRGSGQRYYSTGKQCGGGPF